MPAAIHVTGLRKRYGDRTVVDGIDLDIEAGECFALLGPNGAGKTTTIEILEGFRRRDAGSVSVLDADPARGDRAWRARIGVVGQSVGAPLNLSVRETLDHFSAYHSHRRSTADLLAAVGLEEAQRVRVPDLSGGQRRRLDVALGVQGRPELLFLDEPTTGLDPAARRQFWGLIEDLRSGGTTIVLTTHYLDEAARLADRVAVIARGRILETAPPNEIGAALRQTATVNWTDDRGPQTIATDVPTQTLRTLLADHPSGELRGLEIRRPTLEDVYLAMVEQADSEVG